MSSHNTPTTPRAPTGRDRFFAGVWAASAPLLLWAGHFAFSYVAVAVVCTEAARGHDTLGQQGLHWMLSAGTAVAAVMLLAMLWRAWPRRGKRGLAHRVRRLSALLALIAVIWTGVPLALLSACAA